MASFDLQKQTKKKEEFQSSIDFYRRGRKVLKRYLAITIDRKTKKHTVITN
jgi:hypothetical protein